VKWYSCVQFKVRTLLHTSGVTQTTVQSKDTITHLEGYTDNSLK